MARAFLGSAFKIRVLVLNQNGISAQGLLSLTKEIYLPGLRNLEELYLGGTLTTSFLSSFADDALDGFNSLSILLDRLKNLRGLYLDSSSSLPLT